MKLLFITALLVVWISPMKSTSPTKRSPCQTVLRVKKEAIKYGFETQRRPLQKDFLGITIPSDINGGRRGIPNIGLVDSVVKLAGVQILEVRLPEIDVKIMPNVGIQVSIDTGFHISGRVAVVGNINIKAEARVTVDLRATRTKEGLPIISISACKSVIGGVQVSAGPTDILPGIVNIIKGHVEVVLSEMTCASVSNLFLDFNGHLGMLVGVSAISEKIGMQYTMPSEPVVTQDCVDVIMNVEYEVDKKVVEIPRKGKDFTLPPGAGNPNAMVNLGLSEEFFCSMYTAFRDSRAFDMIILSNTASVKRYLTTAALGSLIPEINFTYKNSLPVNLDIMVTETPVIRFDSNKLLVQITPVVNLLGMTSDGGSRHLMSVSVGATLIARMDVSRGKLMTSVELHGDLTINVNSYSFEKWKINSSVLKGYMLEVLSKGYIVQINAFLGVGVSLPSLAGVDLIHGVVDVKESYTVVSCDLLYTK